MDLGLWIGIIGIVLAVIFGVYAVYSRNNPRADADVRFGVVVQRIAPVILSRRSVPGLGLYYNGEPITSLNELRLAFRNFGPSRLNADDEETPVIVTLGDLVGTILEVESECAERIDHSSFRVRLAPMNVDEVRTVRVLHSFDGLSEDDITVEGDLRNVPRGIRREHADPVSHWFANIVGGSAVVLIPVLLWTVSIHAAFFDNDSDGWPLWQRVLVAALGPPLLVAAMVLPIRLIDRLLDNVGRPFKGVRSRRSPFGRDVPESD